MRAFVVDFTQPAGLELVKPHHKTHNNQSMAITLLTQLHAPLSSIQVDTHTGEKLHLVLIVSK